MIDSKKSGSECTVELDRFFDNLTIIFMSFCSFSQEATRMISLAQATKIASMYMENSRMDFKNNHPNDDLVLVDVIEFPNGWLFFFNSTKFQETKNMLDRLIGLGPVIVDNTNGVVYQAGSYGTVSSWIDEFNEFLQS